MPEESFRDPLSGLEMGGTPSTETSAVPGDDPRPEGEGNQQHEVNEEEKEPGWISLRSSNVRAMKYLKDKKVLQVIYSKGDLYSYAGVPQDTAEGLKTAGSPGSYVWNNIRKKFAFTRG
jgi:hypothetical protein